MEKVEDLMKDLKLSEMENRGLRIGWSDGKKVGSVEPRVIAKLLSDRLAHAKAMEAALGWIWCPMKGATCKDMGDNIFMFTFRQESGKNKALDEGPWMFNKSLLVLEDFVPRKTLKDYEFSTIPIWVRMFGLPLGMMDRDTGESIGDEIGSFMEADVDEFGFAKGKYLRVRVRLNIKKPLMRGIMLKVGEGEDGLWSRFEYEFLPDFCYRCGMLDHIDRDCRMTLAKGEKAQFGSWLKAFIPRQRNDQYGGMWEGGRSMSSGRGSGNTRRYSFNTPSNKFGRESDSWRNKSSSNLTIRDPGKNTEGNNTVQLITENGHAISEAGGLKEVVGDFNTTQCHAEDKIDGHGVALIGIATPTLAGETASMLVDQGGGAGTEMQDMEANKAEVQGEDNKLKKGKNGKFQRIKNQNRSGEASTDVQLAKDVKFKEKKRVLEGSENVDVVQIAKKSRHGGFEKDKTENFAGCRISPASPNKTWWLEQPGDGERAGCSWSSVLTEEGGP
uniref:Uncharacterized protein n=1 Tax=Avena sativa TaxID=4498 RepID=A0ACD5X9G3_AVESA